MVQSPALSVEQYAQQVRQKIDEGLLRFTDFGRGCPDHLKEAIRYSLLAPGKRLRPMLVLMAAEACQGDPDQALPAACAVEMVHAYSLIHDDLPAMDDDDLRRGRPTCHKAFGEAVAILAGDALLALAFRVLADEMHPAEVAAESCAILAQAAGATELVGGQADDLAAESFAADLGALEFIHRRKTGAMILASLQMGAIASGATPDQRQALEQYGRRLGLAFQITDDLLDVRGDAGAMGKRANKDSHRGKLTFPGVLGIEESVRRADLLIAEACDALRPFGSLAGSLEALARYVLDRKH